MSLSTAFMLVLLGIVVIFIVIYMLTQADKRRKVRQNADKSAKKAEAAANRAAWEKWRNK